jgi:hypothetical protein
VSDKLITFAHRVEGVLTDATTVLFSDPAGAFGLRRADTHAVVLADATPFDHDLAVPGVYTYAVTGLTAGVAYEYWVEWTYAGATNRVERTFTAGESDTYSADADLDNAYGPLNVTAWADLNDNTDAGEITARKAWGRGVAYRWVNSKLRGAGLTAPATAGNFSEFDLLADVEAERAGAILYQSRGVNDRQQASGDTDGVMQAHFAHAEAELDRLIGVVTANDGDDGTAAAGTFQSISLAFEPGSTCDEYTSN